MKVMGVFLIFCRFSGSNEVGGVQTLSAHRVIYVHLAKKSFKDENSALSA
jgi:hypothetical protein